MGEEERESNGRQHAERQGEDEATLGSRSEMGEGGERAMEDNRQRDKEKMRHTWKRRDKKRKRDGELQRTIQGSACSFFWEYFNSIKST